MRELEAACESLRGSPPSYRIDPSWRHSKYQPPPPQEVQAITQRSIDIFLLSRGDRVGLGGINGIGWWQAANAYSAIALRDLWSGSHHNYRTLDDILRRCESKHKGFINEFNDDTLWWGMCCLYMYELGGDGWYLDLARGIWRHIRSCGSLCGRGQMRFRDMDMEGGCYWTTRPGEEQINAITSGLFAELSARLAVIDGAGAKLPQRHQQEGDTGSGKFEQKHPHMGGLLSQLKGAAGPSDGGASSRHHPAPREEYLEIARCSLGWVLRCRYRAQDAIVLDSIMTKKDECRDWTFTYLTGVTIGVCAYMYQAIPEDKEYLFLACHMANKAMRRQGWVDGESGVVSAEGEYGKGKHDPVKNNDSVGFKSVLVRELCTLYNVIRTMKAGAKFPRAKETADLIQTCMKVNFESQTCTNTNGNGQYGPWWKGPFETPTSHSQMAVLDVMAAAELVTRK